MDVLQGPSPFTELTPSVTAVWGQVAWVETPPLALTRSVTSGEVQSNCSLGCLLWK